jgi:hypothetical protein
MRMLVPLFGCRITPPDEIVKRYRENLDLRSIPAHREWKSRPYMTLGAGHKGATYGRRVIQLAVARVFELEGREAADLMGTSKSQMYRDIAAHEAAIAEVVEFIRPLIKETKSQVFSIAKAQFAAELEKRLGKAVSAIDKGLESDDKYLEASDRVIHHIVGKPANNLNVQGGLKHEHLHAVLPQETLLALSAVVGNSGALYGRANQLALPEATEAEIV